MKLIFPKKLDQNAFVALSGGVDSIALLYSMIQMGKKPKIAHFIHDDSYAETEFNFVSDIAKEYNLPLVIGEQKKNKKVGSKEQIWRDARYEFFHSLNAKVYVGTNLNDAVEWYLMTCLRGEGHYMEYSNRNVEKPLLLTTKFAIYDYVNSHGLRWIEDPTNHDSSGLRSTIRNEVIPVISKVDPGIFGMVRKRLLLKMK